MNRPLPSDGAISSARKAEDSRWAHAPREQGAFDAEGAAAYLGFKDGRWMDDAPIPRCDLRKPGSTRPVWRWRKIDLDAFLAERVVLPGHRSPWDQG